MATGLIPDDKLDKKPGETVGNTIDDAYESGRGTYNPSDLSDSEQYGTSSDNNIGDTGDIQNSENPDELDSNGPIKTSFNNATKSGIKLALKRFGPAGGIGGGLIAGVFLLLTFFSPSLFLVSIGDSAVAELDTNSTMLERRLVKLLEKKSSSDGSCTSKTSWACKLGRVSNNMLSAMIKNGITPMNGDTEIKPSSSSGYPDKNPTHYKFTGSDGKVTTIKASELQSTYKNNAVFRKMFKKAFNSRYLAYTGKYIANLFYDKNGLSKDGGLAADADSTSDSTKFSDRLKSLLSRSTPDNEESSKTSIKDKIKSILKRNGQKIKKSGGDPIILLASVSCMTIEAPKMVASIYRSIQMVQLMALVQDLILSPKDMLKAGDIDENAVSSIGTVLTETDPETGKSALDSPILLAAMGVNTANTGISEYAPGYSVYTNALTKFSVSASGSTKDLCNTINSPAAAYTSAAIVGAIGAATGGLADILYGAMLGVGKLVVASTAIDKTVELITSSETIMNTVASLGWYLVDNFTDNYVEDIQYEAVGAALGTALMVYFSTASVSSAGSVLTVDQMSDTVSAMQEIENEYREEDIATLSPLDTSSRYTFLGSIMYNLGSYTATSGSTFSSLISSAGYILASPGRLIYDDASAISVEEEVQNKYGYAEDFGIDPEIAISAAGTPVGGVPDEYLTSMSTDEVYNLVKDYIDDETGEPLEDEMVSITLGECGSGDLETLSGCSVESIEASSASGSGQHADSDTGEIIDYSYNVSTDGMSAKERAALSIYLLDYQLELSLSGENEEDFTSSSSSSSTGSIDQDDVIVYNQGDPQWADYSYTDASIGNDIQKCGCGPTTLASIITSLTDNDVTPIDMADFFIANGGARSCGSNYLWEDKDSLFESEYGIEITEVSPSAENARAGLNEGGLVIIHVGGKFSNGNGKYYTTGHYLFIRGVTSSGNFLLGDVGSRTNTNNSNGIPAEDFYFGVGVGDTGGRSTDGTIGMWVVKNAN